MTRRGDVQPSSRSAAPQSLDPSSRPKAVILCGGQGTRIRDVADDLPKPMIRVGEWPILWHIMRTYAHAGITEFVLCLGYKGWAIKEFFLNYRAYALDLTVQLGETNGVCFHDGIEENWSVTLAETGLATQTGGRVWRARRYVQERELFCVTYGDGVADIDIGRLMAFHRAHGRVATVTGVRPPGRFGVMDTHDGGDIAVVRDFREKPQTDQGWINGGFFVFDQRVWRYLDGEDSQILEAEPLQRMSRDGELVMYEHRGFWQPMDTFREWKLLNEMWSSGSAPWMPR